MSRIIIFRYENVGVAFLKQKEIPIYQHFQKTNGIYVLILFFVLYCICTCQYSIHQQPHYIFAHRTFCDGADCEVIVLCMSKSVVFCLGLGLGH